MPISQKNRILAVDDDPLNIRVIKEIFTDGYDLQSVSSGEEAIQMLQHFPADIILLDIMMPGINGYEVCRKVRNDKELKTTKIVLVSAKAMIDDRLEGYGCGADDYVSKPFDGDELLAKVQALSKLDYKSEIEKIKRRILMLFSHELNTPLNAIMGYLQILQQSSPLNDQQKDYLQKIYQGGERLTEISKKALIFCDIKSRSHFLKRSFSLHDIISDVVHQLQFYSSESSIAFSLHLTSDCQVEGDENLMKQALLFVIENAIKFSPPGGVVKISSNFEHKRYSIFIEDQGEGIDKDRHNSIFDEFAINDLSHHQRGQGLSLSMARQIARLHKGDLLVIPEDKRGAKFMFWLPSK